VGVVIIWLVRLFAVQLTKPELRWLTALLGALFGGVALGFLGHLKSGNNWPNEFWFYPEKMERAGIQNMRWRLLRLLDYPVLPRSSSCFYPSPQFAAGRPENRGQRTQALLWET
jgi:hypothetical protein